MIEFVKRKIKTLTLGGKLKKIREEKGVSLSEIAINTKIKREYLEKIEEGKYNELPFDVYVKGFMRSYTKYLGLDSEKVIKQLNKEIGIRENVKKYQDKSRKKNKFKIPSLIITPKMTSIFLTGLIILIGFTYFYLEVDNFSKEPNLILDKSSFSAVISDSFVEIKGKTDFENKVIINNQPVYVDNEGNFKEKVGLQNGLNEIKVEAFNKFENKTEKIINVIAEYETEIKTEVAGEGAEKNGEFEVEIESREDEIKIFLKKDNQEDFRERMLYPEMSLKFKVLEKLEINSGNPQDTYVRIDESEFFVLGEETPNQDSFIINKKGIVSEKEGNSEIEE
jgi:cytoskeletal protein RodZ